MAKKNLPNIPLYIGDWEQKYNVLTIEEEGAWLKIVFKMWTKGDKINYRIPLKSLTKLWKTDLKNCYKIVDSFISNNICEIQIYDNFIEFFRNSIRSRKTILYYLKLKNYRKSFIKIGITSDISSLKRRYSKYGFNEFSILKLVYFSNRDEALLAEKKAHNFFSKYKYIMNVMFPGKTECFKPEIQNKI